MIRLGVIGYGRRMQHLLKTLERFNAGVTVAAMVDPRWEMLHRDAPDWVAEAVAYSSAEAMLDHAELDGVMIGTRCSLHTPYAAAVLARHLPLFLEKPVAMSAAQVAELRAAAATSRSPVVVSFPLRVSAICTTARAIIEAGTIGTVEHVQAVNNVPFYAGGYYHGWMRDDAETGGLWLQKATHDLDYLNFLIGQRPVRIVAMESKTVFRGDMPAGLHCVDCQLQESCQESPYNLFVQGITDSVQPNEAIGQVEGKVDKIQKNVEVKTQL